MAAPVLFSTIEVTRQVFYREALSYAIVNLKPIVPGHVLVIPTRVVPRLADLSGPELSSLITSVQTVGKAIEKAYGGDALTVACQDGKAAGQSIPHVHFHILPRKCKGDFFSQRMDDVYPALEKSEASLPKHFLQSGSTSDNHCEPLRVDADESRPPRTLEEMEKEATRLSTFFARHERKE
ncbi:HIT-like domain-containing protein [Pisolithus croceorrhizus]|nr:HIT-like domain-containing protein [Pisolithus croceorrhizus]